MRLGFHICVLDIIVLVYSLVNFPTRKITRKEYANVLFQGRILQIAFQKKQATEPRSHWNWCLCTFLIKSHLYLWKFKRGYIKELISIKGKGGGAELAIF